MKIGDTVILSSFLGTISPNEIINDHENYWKLIGCEGIIASEKFSGSYRPDLGPQVLVDFGIQPNELGLENHNLKSVGFLKMFMSDLFCVQAK